MAGSTGFEPAIFALTGRRVNQLHHDPAVIYIGYQNNKFISIKFSNRPGERPLTARWGTAGKWAFALGRFLFTIALMRRTPLLLILLQFACLPPLWAGLDSELSDKLRVKSAETFFEAISYELKKNTSSKAALARIAPETLAAALGRKAPAGESQTQAELFSETAARIPLSGLDENARKITARAIEEARTYIAPGNLPPWSKTAIPAPQKAPGRPGHLQKRLAGNGRNRSRPAGKERRRRLHQFPAGAADRGT